MSAVVSAGVHGLLFLAFFLLLAWSEPDPPIPEFGIELDLGSEVVSESPSYTPTAEEVPEETEEVLEEITPEMDESTETLQQNTVQDVSQQEDASDIEPLTEDINSPDVVEETESTAADTALEDEAEIIEEEKTDQKNEAAEDKEVHEVDERAIFKRDPNTNGDQNTKGSSLELAGWDWDFRPEPNDKSSENGLIVFQITIDKEGEIIGIKTLEKTVSPVVEKVYRDAVRDLTFSKTSDNRAAAATSTGKITFIIQSN